MTAALNRARAEYADFDMNRAKSEYAMTIDFDEVVSAGDLDRKAAELAEKKYADLYRKYSYELRKVVEAQEKRIFWKKC